MKKIPTVVWVAAAALIAPDGAAVLVQQRRAGARHGGLWEFPGGKIERNETPEAALCRELHEELGIDIAPRDLRPFSFSTSAADGPDHPSAAHAMLLYTCRRWSGTPRCLDAAALAWVPPAELAALAMPPLDVPLARALGAAIERDAGVPI